MRPISNEQAQEWVSVAIEVAENQREKGCKCATCLTLIALNATRRESSDSPKEGKKVFSQSGRGGWEMPGHKDGCRCRECDPSR